MKLNFWKKPQPVQPKHNLSVSLSQRFFRALIEIRDDPKHAKRKANEALVALPMWRQLYGALAMIEVNPFHAQALAQRAMAEHRLATKLARALIEIRNAPKLAGAIAAAAVIEGAKAGARTKE